MDKPLEKMEWNEFIDWATGFVLIGLGGGRDLHGMMHTITYHAINNEVFGTKQKKKKGK